MGKIPDQPNKEPIFDKPGYFGFSESPFDYQSEVRFFYPAPSQFSILTHILRQYEQKFIRLMVLGKKTSGRTIMAQMLTALLEEENKVEVRYYYPQSFPLREMTLRVFMDALQLEWLEDFNQSLQYLKETFVHQAVIQKPYFLIMEQNTSQKRIFSDAVLYELLQLMHEGQPVFHLVWFAIEKPSGLKFLSPKAIDEYDHLPDMRYREMVGMIKYRCSVVGQKKPPFTQEALKQIFHLTNGNPGQTVRLCDFALNEALGERKRMCGIEEVNSAWRRWII